MYGQFTIDVYIYYDRNIFTGQPTQTYIHHFQYLEMEIMGSLSRPID